MKMKRTQACRPSLDALESRVVLSFSLSSIFHSLLGTIDGNSSTTTTTTPVRTPAQIAAHNAAVQAHKIQVQARIAHAQELRIEHAQQLHPHSHPVLHVKP
jgi:hypothetical protein